MVKNQPANAGCMGSTPGPGELIPHAPGQLDSCMTTKPLCQNLNTLGPMLCNKRSRHNKEPAHYN